MTLNPMIADELSSLTNEVDELAEISTEVIIENFILYTTFLKRSAFYKMQTLFQYNIVL